MKYLVATFAADGVPHVVSTNAYETPAAAWAAIFNFDHIARDSWAQDLASRAAKYDVGSLPDSDTHWFGSIHRWALVRVP